ncbi:MAG: Transcriptional regulatory protein QseF [Syntrophorhabdus sp. PtaU1.Bin058]|nr:MAG: Transcriptional regulatory protein QseF [Syntrophorhabdus sp. PtaU1.Bin058]
MNKILLVDDEKRALEMLERVLKMAGYITVGVTDPRTVQGIIKKEQLSVAVFDLMMPGMNGLDLLESVRDTDPDLPVIILTGHGTIKTAVEAVKRGAFDYVTKPYDIDEVDLIIKRAIQQRRLLLENKILREKLLERSPLSKIVTEDRAMERLLKEVQTLANINTTTLITGESGTGKELIAKALHFSGIRHDKPFVTIDCGGIPETILESEIFGHVKGAFTGAHVDKKGYMEVAERGTVFFDEISELPFFLQKKLLRAIQEKEFSKVGDTRTIKANIRIIAATNKDLKEEVSLGKFREDLFYRLNVVSLRLPPLRDRFQDIPLLAHYFLAEFNIKFNKRVNMISEEALGKMMAYDWPGNIRELKNTIERVVVFKEDKIISLQDLPDEIRRFDCDKVEDILPLKEFRERTLGNMTKDYIKMLLALYKGNVSKAAARAQIDRGNFRKLMKRFAVSAREYRQ